MFNKGFESEALKSNMLNNQATEEGAEVRSGNCVDEKIIIDRMFKLVESAPMSSGNLTVSLVFVETVSKVWVTRKELEPKVKKLMAALEGMENELDYVSNVTIGCVYGARFSEDGLMYRAVVEDVEESKVWVRYMDYGNRELIDVREMVNLPEKMARLPAAAVMVEIEDNRKVEDSQSNRDRVEMELEGDVDMEFVNNRLTRILVAGKIVNFHFENTKKIGQALEELDNNEKNFVKVHENSGSTKASKDIVEEKTSGRGRLWWPALGVVKTLHTNNKQHKENMKT